MSLLEKYLLDLENDLLEHTIELKLWEEYNQSENDLLRDDIKNIIKRINTTKKQLKLFKKVK